MQRIVLADDGTLDTVIQCLDCGEQFRFNFSPEDCGPCNDIDAAECTHYDEFVADCISEIESEHECENITATRAELESLASALSIVKSKRADAFCGPSAVYDKLARIAAYLDKEHRKAFEALCEIDR